MFKKLFLTLALMLTGPWLGAQTWDVRTHTLRNGMKILIRENHTIPKMGYSPANATLVVCGDVKFATVIQLAQRWLGPIKSRERPRPITTREPEQQGERRTRVIKSAQLPAQLPVRGSIISSVPRLPSRFPVHRALLAWSTAIAVRNSSPRSNA